MKTLGNTGKEQVRYGMYIFYMELHQTLLRSILHKFVFSHMVVADSAIATCEIYEVKHSKEQTKGQYRHLIDEEKLKSTEFRYGKIKKKVVIYRGENTTPENGIEYRNVEEYLKSLV